VLGRRPRGLFRIQPVVGIACLFQPVLLAPESHELPHPRGPCAGYRARVKARFRLRQVDQLLRHALFRQDPLNHRPVPPGPLQTRYQGAVAASHEIVDVTRDRIVHRKRQLRGGGQRLFLQLVLQVGIHREGHLQNIFERGLVESLLIQVDRCAQSRQVVTVDRLNHGFQLALPRATVRLREFARLQHQVQRRIELQAGLLGLLLLVQLAPRLHVPFGPLDQLMGTEGCRRSGVRRADQGRNVADVRVWLDNRRLFKIGNNHARRRRRKEGGLESGVLCISATGRGKHDRENRREQAQLRSTNHLSPRNKVLGGPGLRG